MAGEFDVFYPSLLQLHQINICISEEEQVLMVKLQLQAIKVLGILLSCCRVLGEDLLRKVDKISEMRV